MTFSLVFVVVAVIYKPTRGRGPKIEKGTKMQKLTYRNEHQLFDDAVKMLLERHLSWSGSNESMPSRDLDNVRGQFLYAHVDADFTDEEWDALSEEGRKEYANIINAAFGAVAAEADLKWASVKVMLDL